MAHPNAAMDCAAIHEKIKVFLEDLLAEDEYKAFCDHIHSCSKCRKYVRSFGALPNLLWKLGRVKVPEDLGTTILYKFAHPEGKPKSSRSFLSAKPMILITVLILLGGAVFFRTDYFKKGQAPHKEGVPPVKTEVSYEQTVPTDGEAKLLLQQLETIATNLGTSPADIISEGTKKENRTVKAVKKEAPPEKPPVQKPAELFKISFLHWHFLCVVKFEEADLKKEIESLDLKISQGLERQKLLSAEWERLQASKREAKSGQPYLGSVLQNASGPTAPEESESQQLLDGIKRQEDIIKMAEEAKQRSENDLRRGIEEKDRKSAELNSKLLEAIGGSGISADYQKNDLLMFEAAGEKIEKLLGRILALSSGGASFRDFTANVFTLRDKAYRAAIYVEREKSNVLHWHIDPILPDKKSEILGILKESSTSVNYEPEGLAVLSIASGNIGKLRTRIQAARVPFTEYGTLETKESTLSSGPVTLSIYFGQ